MTPSFLAGQQVNTFLKLQHNLQSFPANPQKAQAYHQLITELQGQDPKVTLRLIDQLYQLSAKIKYPEGTAYAHYQKGIYYNLQGKFDSLRVFADKCLKLSKYHHLPKTEAFGYQLIATYHWQTGKFDEAVNHHLKALKIREKLNDSAGIGSSLASLSGVSLSNNKITRAKNYSQKSLAIGKQLNDDKIILRSLHTLANIYGTEGDYRQALKFDYEALEICARTQNRRNYGEIYSNMALCFFYMGDYNASLKYHYKVLEIDRFFKDDKQIGDTYLNLASVFAAKKDHIKAEKLLNNAIGLFKKTNYKIGLRNAYQSLSKTYQQSGDYKKALATSQQYLKVANQISNEKNDQNIARLNVQYETEKKEQQIKTLNQQSTIQKLQINRRNTILAITAGLLVISALFGYLLLSRRKLVENVRLQQALSKQQELSVKAIFNAEDQERRRIAAELHDGVGQILSCALMNLNSLFESVDLKQEQADLAHRSLALVTESYDEMRSISHQMIPNSLLKNGLAQALRESLSKIDEKIIRVQLNDDGLASHLDAQTETALYRIIQEAFNNVLKHAQATKVYISLMSDADGISVTIEDNGNGFDSTLIHENKGIGLKNIRTRIESLKGTVEFDTAPGKGTLVVINLPS